MQGENYQLHFQGAQERSLLLPLCLKGGETVLDPNLGGKDEESKRKLPLAGTAAVKREEQQEWLCTGALSKGEDLGEAGVNGWWGTGCDLLLNSPLVVGSELTEISSK